MTEVVDRLSPSSLKLYRQCPRRFEIRHVEGVRDPSGVPGLTGTFTHRVLELLYGLPADERTVTAAHDLIPQAWEDLEADEAWARSLPTPDEAVAIRIDGVSAVEAILALENAQNVTVAATEQRFRVDVEGVTLTGVIDRVDDTLMGPVINDYKTGRVRDPDWRQLLLYAVAYRILTDQSPIAGRYIYARGGIFEGEITDGGMTAMVRDLHRAWAAIQRSLDGAGFRPKPQPLCGWCPYVARCPEGARFVRQRYSRRRDVPAFARLRPPPAL